MAGADWNLPSLSSTYSDFLTYLKTRDFDAISLCYSGHPTNPQTGMISYLRASDVLEEYNGAAWVTKLLAVAGGGTGAATAAGARTNLGLGSIATQAASGVAITGGSITGLGTFTTSGAVTIGAGITAGSGSVGIIDSTGKIPAISSTYFASLSGANLTNLNGSNIASGTVNYARLGSGGGGSTKFLREDNTWQTVSNMRQVVRLACTLSFSFAGNQGFTISPALLDITKAYIASFRGPDAAGQGDIHAVITSTTVITITNINNSQDYNGKTYYLEIAEFN